MKAVAPSEKPPFPPQATLYDVIRKSRVRKRVVEQNVGNVDDAFKSAAKVRARFSTKYPRYATHPAMGKHHCRGLSDNDGAANTFHKTNCRPRSV